MLLARSLPLVHQVTVQAGSCTKVASNGRTYGASSLRLQAGAEGTLAPRCTRQSRTWWEKRHTRLRTGWDRAHLGLQAGGGPLRGWQAPERARPGPAGPLGPGQTPGGTPGCSVHWPGPGRAPAPWLCRSPSLGPCPAAGPAWPCPAPAEPRCVRTRAAPSQCCAGCVPGTFTPQLALPGLLLHKPYDPSRVP